MGIVIAEAVLWIALTLVYLFKGYISMDSLYIGITIAIATICLILRVQERMTDVDSKKQKTYTVIVILLRAFAYLFFFAAGFVSIKNEIYALYVFVLGVYLMEKSDHYELLYMIEKGG